jgi:ABC-type sugar transport system ATPase subunit
MRAEIKSFLGSVGVPVIYVTHDQSEAMTLGTRVAVMNAGKVIQVGRPLELYEKPQNIFVAGFVGNPPMNILPLSAVNGLAAPPGHQRNEVAIGVRPMDLNIDGKGDVMISARITLMEILGDEVIIHAAMDSLSLVIKKELKTAAGLRVGDVIAIGLEENKVHWFRLSDGSRIEVNGN